MDKPMKRFTNGVLNYNLKNTNVSNITNKLKYNNSFNMQEQIKTKSKEKEINDSRLDKKKYWYWFKKRKS